MENEKVYVWVVFNYLFNPSFFFKIAFFENYDRNEAQNFRVDWLDYELLFLIETDNFWVYHVKMASVVFAMVRWYVNFFNFFLETNFSIQLSLRQFLFEVNRISNNGDNLKKLYTNHHVFSITGREKFTGRFHKFHIPLSVKKFFKKVKKSWRSSQCAGVVAVQC